MPKNLPVSGKIGFVLPVLTGCFLVLSLFSTQAFRLGWELLPPALAIGAIVGLSTWAIFYVLPLTKNSAALVATAATAMALLWMVFPYPIMPIMITLSVIIVLYDLPKTLIRSIGSIVLSVIIAATGTSLLWATVSKIQGTQPEAGNNLTVTVLASTPDIYFICPDRFTSIMGLDNCDYDATWFMKELNSRGFHVQPDKLSLDPVTIGGGVGITTTRTLRFMAALLNGGIDIDLTIAYNRASSMVKHSSIVKMLKDNGYEYHQIGDWWQETLNNPEADYNYVYHGYSVMDYLSSNELAMAVVDRSWFRDLNAGSLLPRGLLVNVNRARNTFQQQTFEHIVSTNSDSPRFVFAHILLPHPPYDWAADGAQMPAGLSVMEQYLQQTQFTMKYLLDMIDAIADPNAIVIIQSDEGIAFSNPKDNTDLVNDQWNGVLCAWRIPGANTTELDNLPTVGILGYVLECLSRQS